MPKGLTSCRICGKTVFSLYRKHHETRQCLRMRYLRGDKNVTERFNNSEKTKPIHADTAQQDLLQYM
ncbi:MAG: hypothetical protein FWC33_02135 [Candidatus Bathyarchaeota archaeon]|nr:hypothetical protein [Candidatus Termiticorpusculum sp.]